MHRLHGNLQFNVCKSSARHRPWRIYIHRESSAPFSGSPHTRPRLIENASRTFSLRSRPDHWTTKLGSDDHRWSPRPTKTCPSGSSIVAVLLKLKMLKTKNIQLVLVVNCLFNICGTGESYHANFVSFVFFQTGKLAYAVWCLDSQVTWAYLSHFLFLEVWHWLCSWPTAQNSAWVLVHSFLHLWRHVLSRDFCFFFYEGASLLHSWWEESLELPSQFCQTRRYLKQLLEFLWN